ncbi:hypothetical protein TorRG33x02_241170 [Trema orientale]|uniref:Uncharacterized protein n=1 Tax=Trema orientale TaxID=63057 RepID=A0A2P5DV24_TREOI|nr:hypothetical protein TorRG33x02_241170 [Trema orientale]
MSGTNTLSTQAVKKDKKRARNEDPFVDILNDSVNKFGNMQVVANDNIRRLDYYFKFETDSAARKMKVFGELKRIHGLTNDERVKLGQLFIQNQTNTDYFFTVDDEFKLVFLMQLLR